jgi:uncharacterized membrane protein YvbJ
MFKNLNVPKNNDNNNIKLKNIIKNNKKLDYETIKSLVDDASNIRTSQQHMSNKRHLKLK